jgi:hypothetical protein
LDTLSLHDALPISGGIFAVLHTDVVDRRRFLSSDKDDEEQATSKNRKKKRKKVQLGPLLGMIAFVAFLRAVLPTYWYTKSTDDATSKKTSVELTEKKNTKDIQQRQRQQPPNKDSKGELQQENTWNHLIFCIVGIQVCYLAWGTAQERLMAHSYGSTVSGAGGEHFHHSTVLLLFNKVLSASLAILLLTRTASSSSSTPSFSLRTILFQTAPPLLYSYAALGNGISSWCQYEALKHTIFPVVVVFKSSKMIPVMLIGSLKFFGKTYPLRDYVVAAIIAVGVTVALVSGGKGGGSGGAGKAGKQKKGKKDKKKKEGGGKKKKKEKKPRSPEQIAFTAAARALGDLKKTGVKEGAEFDALSATLATAKAAFDASKA